MELRTLPGELLILSGNPLGKLYKTLSLIAKVTYCCLGLRTMTTLNHIDDTLDSNLMLHQMSKLLSCITTLYANKANRVGFVLTDTQNGVLSLMI